MSTTKQLSNSSQVSRLVLRDYKSIVECDLKLGRLNILNGANGAGKFNFIFLFYLLNRILNQQLLIAVSLGAGVAAIQRKCQNFAEWLQKFEVIERVE